MFKTKMAGWQQLGFTLIELLMAIAVIGILMTVAFATMGESVDNTRLRGAVEALYGDLLLAKNEAVSSGAPVYLVASTGASWCYGLSSSTGCTCGGSTCKVNSALYERNVDGYPNISLATNNMSGEITIGAMQGKVLAGMSTSPITFTLTNSNSEAATVTLTDFGTITYCSNNIAGFPSC
jgi:type IV fimbrial biogenesis protein FimT